MKKFNTVRLLFLLVALVLIYAGIEYFSNTGRSKSLRTELVNLSKEDITQLIISGPDKELTLTRSGDAWSIDNGLYTFPAEPDRVSTAMSTLETIKPSRIATRNPGKWKDFQVDSTGTRVRVFQGDDISLDIVLGRFGMQNQQQFHTFVRLFNENDVYAANDFMAFSFPQDLSGYRNNSFLKLSPDSLIQIEFNYLDSSFVMEKSLNNRWAIEGVATDSASTASYLNGLRNVISSKLFEGDPSTILASDMRVTLTLSNSEIISVEAQQSPQLLFSSTQNSNTLFTDPTLLDKIFAGRQRFLPAE